MFEYVSHTACCLPDSGCELYKTRVSWHYEGDVNTAPPILCYSCWGSSKDAAHNASITATQAHDDLRTADLAINGFYCMVESNFCYCSTLGPVPWWKATLDTSRQVTAVRVQTRYNAQYGAKFQNVEVRVGNNTNFMQNPLLGYYSGPAAQREVVTFTADGPITGSIVSLQSMINNSNTCFCDVQILYV